MRNLTPIASAIASSLLSGAITFCAVPTFAASSSLLTGNPPDMAATYKPNVNEFVQVGSAKLGYLPGDWSVNSSGNFNYSIPLDLPPARRGMVPNIGLSYGGGTDDGLVGVGWQLTGFSSITRAPKTLAHDGVTSPIEYTQSAAKFSLDGKELILISGSAGAAGATYKTLSDDNVLVKIDSVIGGEPAQFTVQTADGRVKVYSTTVRPTRTRFHLHGQNGSRMDTVLWLLNTESDAFGNTIKYNYDIEISDQTFGNNNRVSYAPTSVTYNGKDGTNSWRNVQFEYEDLADLERPEIVSWEDGVQYVIQKRLKSIVMFAPNPIDTAEVWRYNLSYNDDKTEMTGQSRLGSVQKCGALGGCTWTKEFDWDVESVNAVPQYRERDIPITLPFMVDVLGQYVRGVYVFDANGDGLDDLFVEKKENPTTLSRDARLYTSTVTYENGIGTSSSLPLSQVQSLSLSSKKLDTDRVQGFPNFNALDIDSNGTVEIFADNTNGRTLFKKPNSSYAYEAVLDRNGNAISYPATTQVLWADMNGDGLTDMLVGENTNTEVAAIANYSGIAGPCHPTYDADKFGSPTYAGYCGLSAKPYYQWSVRLNSTLGLSTPTSVGSPQMCSLSAVDPEKNGRWVFQFKAGRVEESERFTISGDASRWYTINRIVCDGESKRIGVDQNNNVTLTSGTFSGNDEFEGYGRYADFNGDGLLDTISRGTYATNTGWGFHYETVSIDPDPSDVTAARVLVDINGDGLTDAITPPNGAQTASVRYANADGSFKPAVSLAISGNGLIPGDFNGDGMTDFATVTGSGYINIYFRESPHGARLIRVRDANPVAAKGSVNPAVVEVSYKRPIFERGYSGGFIDALSKGTDTACSYPLICHTGGMVVVDKVTDTTTSPEPEAANVASAKERQFRYFYENPVSDRRGNGFLGFGAFGVWDYDQAKFVRNEYGARSTEVTLSGNRIVYPYAHHATTTYVLQGLVRDEEIRSASSHTAQLFHSKNILEYQTPESGKLYRTQTRSQAEREYQTSISSGAYDWWVGRVSAGSLTLDRTTTSTFTYDSSGFMTRAERQITAPTLGSKYVSETPRTSVTFGNYRWLGLLDSVTVTATESTGTSAVRKTDYSYDSKGQLDVVTAEPDTTDPLLKQKTKFYYDDSSGVLKGIGKIGKRTAAGADIEQITRFEYEPLFGEPAEQIFPTHVWQQNGNLSTGHLSAWMATHPATGMPLMMMDANGVKSEMRYDDLGRAVLLKQDGVTDTSITYGERTWAGGVIAGMWATASSGSQWQTSYYNSAGQTVKAAWPGFDGASVSAYNFFDVLGRLQQSHAPSSSGYGLTTTYDYDALGRLLLRDGPGDGDYDCTYLSRFITQCNDESGHKNRIERDINGRMELSINRTTEHGDLITEYKYHPFDLLKSVSDPDDHVTSFEYDVHGRQIQITHPDAGISKTYFNGLGEVSKVEVPKLNTTDAEALYTEVYDYDNFSRVKTVTSPDGTASFYYDNPVNGLGKLDYAVSPFNVKTKYDYNQYGQLSNVDTTLNYGVTGETTYSVGMTYNGDGLLDKLAFPTVSGRTRFTTQNNYNSQGYLTSINDVSPSVPSARLWNVTARDAMSRLTEGFLGDNVAGRMADGRIKLSQAFDPTTGRLQRITAKNASATTNVLDYEYSYFANGQVSQRKENVESRIEDYTYDGVGRLTAWQLRNGPSATTQNWQFAYAADGNMTSVTGPLKRETFTHSPSQPHQVTRVATETRATPTSSWGSATNRDYTYDTRGRRKESGSGSPAPTIAYTFFNLPKTIGTKTFAYDAFGNRVQRINATNDSTVYIGGIYEKRTKPSSVEHVYHVSTGEAASVDVVFNSAVTPSTKFEYTIKDRIGSSGIVLNGSNAGSGFGSTLQRLYFEPFGKRINSNGSDFSGSLSNHHDKTGLTGHEYDDDLGLVNMRGRMYDSKTRRFLTTDPFAVTSLGQSWNGYGYVRNDPVNLTDPSGFMTEQDLDNCASYSYTDGQGVINVIGLCGKTEITEGPLAFYQDDSAWRGGYGYTRSDGSTGNVVEWELPEKSNGANAVDSTPENDAKIVADNGGIYDPRLRPDGSMFSWEDKRALRELPIVGPLFDDRVPWTKEAEADKGIMNFGLEVLEALATEGGSLLGKAASRGGTAAELSGGVAERVIKGGSGRAFAGHGCYTSCAGKTVVPNGTAITLPRHDAAISDFTGRLLENGDWDTIAFYARTNERVAADLEGMATYLPGAEIPNYGLSQPRGLIIMEKSITTSSFEELSDLLTPNSGCMVWASCTSVITAGDVLK